MSTLPEEFPVKYILNGALAQNETLLFRTAACVDQFKQAAPSQAHGGPASTPTLFADLMYDLARLEMRLAARNENGSAAPPVETLSSPAAGRSGQK